jgi:hypothetical protein
MLPRPPVHRIRTSEPSGAIASGAAPTVLVAKGGEPLMSVRLVPPLLAAVAALGLTVAAAGPPLQPFAQFVRGIETAQAGAYVGAPGAAVRDTQAFDEMRRYLLRLYHGVSVRRSFARDGQVFDCVPMSQQPGLRGAAPDPAQPVAATTAPSSCAAGTIPILRVTLARITRFATLADFLHKAPGGKTELPPRTGR